MSLNLKPWSPFPFLGIFLLFCSFAIFLALGGRFCFLFQGFGGVPSDRKVLLPKNYSEIINFVKITNFTRNSLKKSLFPGVFESAKCLKNNEKYFSGNFCGKNFVSDGSLPKKQGKSKESKNTLRFLGSSRIPASKGPVDPCMGWGLPGRHFPH